MCAKTLRICGNGHHSYKSSDCPVCPICESQQQREVDFLSTFGAPVRRAFERVGIIDIAILAKYSEKEILDLHGVGPASLPKLRALLEKHGLTFQSKK